MGYDLHITRKEHWAEDEQPVNNISINEWLAYIDNDAELKISDAYKIKIPGSEIESIQAPCFCDWLNHPQKEKPWFDYRDGNITTKNPDKYTIQKMLSIAKTLNAKVQGDDGEIYGKSSSKKIFYYDGFGNAVIVNPDKKPWWKFWLK